MSNVTVHPIKKKSKKKNIIDWRNLDEIRKYERERQRKRVRKIKNNPEARKKYIEYYRKYRRDYYQKNVEKMRAYQRKYYRKKKNKIDD